MLTRRQFVSASAGLAALAVAPSTPERLAFAQDHGCNGVHLGATRKQIEEFGCVENITKVDNFLHATVSNNGALVAEHYIGMESKQAWYIETRLRGDASPDGLPLPDAVARFTDGQVPGGLNAEPLYNQTVGLSTKTTGYVATVGRSQELADVNGRSGYFVKLYACTAGADAAGIPEAASTMVSSAFVATETDDPMTIAPLVEDGSPRLGADSSAWTEAYGEGGEGENGTLSYPELIGAPNVAISRQMQGQGKVQEIAAYGIDPRVAGDLVAAYLPVDATMESTYLLPPTPDASYAVRLQQWASPSLQMPICAMYIYQGAEGQADVDAVILSYNGQLSGFPAGQ